MSFIFVLIATETDIASPPTPSGPGPESDVPAITSIASPAEQPVDAIFVVVV